MTVLALPGWAVGTFDGAMTGVDGTNTYGKFNGTVGTTGKISFKLTYTSQLSGKVAGDTKMVSVNGSAQLLPYMGGKNVLFAQTLVYVAPKSGLSSGFIKAYDLAFWIGEDGKVESVGTILRGGQIAEVAKNVTDTTYVVSFSREDADVTAGQFTVRVAADGIVKASGTIDGLSYSGTSDLVINSYGGIEIPVIATDKKGDIIVFKIDAPAVEEADVVELNIANVVIHKGDVLLPAQIEAGEDAAAASAKPYDVAPALYMGVGYKFIPNTLED